MGVNENVLLVAHRLKFSGVVVDGCGAGDVGNDAKIFVEHGKKPATSAVFGPIVDEVGDEEIFSVLADLAGIAAGQVNVSEFLAVETQPE